MLLKQSKVLYTTHVSDKYLVSHTSFNMKSCNRCNEVKPLEDFVKRSNRPTPYQAYCKVCHNKSMRSVDRSEYMRGYDLNKTYGISVDDFNQISESQNHQCAICKKTAKEKIKVGKKKYLCVDHCHDSGKVRGLLCDQCNRAIGLLKEDLQLFTNAIEYLSK